MLDKMDFKKFKDNGTLVLWVIGGPGSGKSSLCSELAEQFSFWHISASELLNNLVAPDPTKENDDYTTLKKSRIIPTSIVLFLIKQEMATHNDKKGT